MTLRRVFFRGGLLVAVLLQLVACQPEPPADLTSGQRAAIDKAQQLGQQMQQQLDTRMQAAEPAEQ